MTSDAPTADPLTEGQVVEPFTWTGDLDDDCLCRWRGLVAHVECLFDAADDPGFDPLNDVAHEGWHASVSVDGSRDYLWHADAEDLMPKSGPAARRLCERIMRGHAAEAKLAFLEEKGITVGLMKTSDRPEPYLAYDIRSGSELDDTPTLSKLTDAEVENARLRAEVERLSRLTPERLNELLSDEIKDALSENADFKQRIATLTADLAEAKRLLRPFVDDTVETYYCGGLKCGSCDFCKAAAFLATQEDHSHVAAALPLAEPK